MAGIEEHMKRHGRPLSADSTLVNTRPARSERAWWDEHAEPIYVWGEEGDAAWHAGVSTQLDRLIEESAPYGEFLSVDTVLDVGCGMGRLLIPWMLEWPSTSKAHGVDVSPAMLDKARSAALISGVEGIEWHQTDGRTLPDVGPVDFAWSVLLFQHIPHDAQEGYVREVARLLRPGGRFVVQIDAADGLDGGEFLHWHTGILTVAGWADDAGLLLVRSVPDDRYPQWAWLTFEKDQ